MILATLCGLISAMCFPLLFIQANHTKHDDSDDQPDGCPDCYDPVDDFFHHLEAWKTPQAYIEWLTNQIHKADIFNQLTVRLTAIHQLLNPADGTARIITDSERSKVIRQYNELLLERADIYSVQEYSRIKFDPKQPDKVLPPAFDKIEFYKRVRWFNRVKLPIPADPKRCNLSDDEIASRFADAWNQITADVHNLKTDTSNSSEVLTLW